MFKSGKWIWHKDGQSKDLYVNFINEFECGQKNVLKIAADSDYTVYVNGSLAAFGQYQSYPDRRVYDEVDISGFTKPGKNLLAVTVW